MAPVNLLLFFIATQVQDSKVPGSRLAANLINSLHKNGEKVRQKASQEGPTKSIAGQAAWQLYGESVRSLN